MTRREARREEFKAQVHTMTYAQKKQYCDIKTQFVHEVNEREFKTKKGYKNAMAKAYDKTIVEYFKLKNQENEKEI